jgi:hypothetical protein
VLENGRNVAVSDIVLESEITGRTPTGVVPVQQFLLWQDMSRGCPTCSSAPKRRDEKQKVRLHRGPMVVVGARWRCEFAADAAARASLRSQIWLHGCDSVF